MLIEKSPSQPKEAELPSTSSTAIDLRCSLNANPAYRQSLVEEAIRSRVTARIHTLRTKNQWDFKDFAEKLGQKGFPGLNVSSLDSESLDTPSFGEERASATFFKTKRAEKLVTVQQQT